MAVNVASGCAVPAAPELPSAAEREAKLAPDGRSPARTSKRSKRSAPSAADMHREGHQVSPLCSLCAAPSGALARSIEHSRGRLNIELNITRAI